MKLYLTLIGAALLLFATGCVSNQETGSRSYQKIDESVSPSKAMVNLNRDKIDQYKSLDLASDTIFIDQLTAVGENEEFYKFVPATMAYEGVRLLSLLRLADFLPIKSQYQFIKAMFSDISTNVKIGEHIRNIVVPHYFSDGSPLICAITIFKTGPDKAIVVIYNADNLRKLPADIQGKDIVPSVEYPGVYKDEDKSVIVGDYYVFTIINDNRITSFSGATKTPEPISSIKTDWDRVNLSDDYLRDAYPENDNEVEKLLEPVLNNPEADFVLLLVAKINNFLRQLYSGDYEGAEKSVATLPIDPLLQDNNLDITVKKAIQFEVPTIYRITMAMIENDESFLVKEF